MKAFLQYFLILLALAAVSWIVIPARYDISYPRDVKPQFDNYIRRKYVNAIDEQQPGLLLLGDSMLYPAVNTTVLSQKLDKKIMSIGLPGSASTLWYLIVKNNIIEAIPAQISCHFLPRQHDDRARLPRHRPLLRAD